MNLVAQPLLELKPNLQRFSKILYHRKIAKETFMGKLFWLFRSLSLFITLQSLPHFKYVLINKSYSLYLVTSFKYTSHILHQYKYRISTSIILHWTSQSFTASIKFRNNITPNRDLLGLTYTSGATPWTSVKGLIMCIAFSIRPATGH